MTQLLIPSSSVSEREVRALLRREHPGHFAEAKFGFHNQPFHWEWYNHELVVPRLCVVAPREYAKSEVFSVCCTAWYAARWTGFYQYIFEDTLDQAKSVLERIVSAVGQANPDLTSVMYREESTDVIFANHSRVRVAGRGKKVRGAHPDRIVGDDVLDEDSTATSYQRNKVNRWWGGTVAGMAHTGTYRRLGWGKARGNVVMLYYPPTKIRLVGTPFHGEDLLMAMRRNPIYRFYRYQAEFDPEKLIPGTLAVEAA